MGTAEGSGDAGVAAELAGERVREIVAAAEQAAAAIVADAETEARRIRAAAEVEADEVRSAARAESEAAVDAASRDAGGRIEQARGAVEGIVAQADRLRAQVGALGRDLVSGPPDSEPDEDAEAELGTGREGDETEAAPGNEDLAAQLHGAPAEVGPAESGPAPEADHGAVRLVALNMALDGASRDEIEQRIEADFGPVAGIDALIDDVLSRAGR